MKIKVGDTVKYQTWSGPKMRAKVTEIALCDEPGEKYGDPVDEVSGEEVDQCVISLDTERWIYGDQVVSVEEDKNE